MSLQNFSKNKKADETELIFCYRQLSPADQNRLMKVARYLIDSEELEIAEKVRSKSRTGKIIRFQK